MKTASLTIILLLALSACRATEQKAAADGEPEAAAQAEMRTSTGPLGVGSPMPEYRATTLAGEPFEMSEMRGKVVLLNIWATWCGPCRYEIPDLIELQNRFAAKGFDVLGVSVDAPETQKEVAPMVAERGINYPILLDPDGAIANLFETSVIPTSALVDRNGRIVWTHIGIVDVNDREMLDVLNRALDAQS
ncbi:MAG TPA: TlpA disulfide reductase family protein [Thermoanaerobaculia bacterium]|nr:TlpA disulfide reductase family protein [Thermoanaerobaculia bacterium]